MSESIQQNKKQMLFSIGFIVALYYIVLAIGGFSILEKTRIPHITVKNSIFGIYDDTSINLYAIGSATGKQTSSSTAGKIHVADFYPDDAGAEVLDNTAKIGGGLLSLGSSYIGMSSDMPFVLVVEHAQFLPYLFIISLSFLVRGLLKLAYVGFSVKTQKESDLVSIFRLSDIQYLEQLLSAIEATVVLRMIGITEINTICSIIMLIVLFESLIYSQHEVYLTHNKEVKDVRQIEIRYEYSAKCWASMLSALFLFIYIIVLCANFGKEFDALPPGWSAFTIAVSNSAIAAGVLYFFFRFLLCSLSIMQVFFGDKIFTHPINNFVNFQVCHTFLHVAAVTVLAACVFNVSTYDSEILV